MTRQFYDEEEDGKTVLKTGDKLTVRMIAYDHAVDLDRHRPGYRFASDAAADTAVADARADYISRISNAWRAKDQFAAADAVIDVEIAAAAPGTDPRVAALAARQAWLESAWRTP